MKMENSCGAVVFRWKGDRIEYLILKYKPERGGHWSFPKGHMEKGESERETAEREVFEEAGLRVNLIDGFCEETVFSPKPGVMKTVTFFLGEALSDDVKHILDEAEDHRWLRFDDAMKRLTHEENKELLKKANAFILCDQRV